MYPPGIPLLIEGECVTAAHVQALEALQKQDALGSGTTITGLSDVAGGASGSCYTIRVHV